MQTIRKILDKILAAVSITILAIITLLVIYQVITRYVLNRPSSWSEAVVTYGFIWLTMFCGAYVFGKRDHMAMTFVLDRFKGKAGIIIRMLIELIVMSFAAGVLVYGGYFGAMKQMAQADSALPITMGVIYIAIPLSGVCTFIYFLCNEYDLFQQLRGGQTAPEKED